MAEIRSVMGSGRVWRIYNCKSKKKKTFGVLTVYRALARCGYLGALARHPQTQVADFQFVKSLGLSDELGLAKLASP